MDKQQIAQLIHDIAEMVDCGHICFLNPETLEHICIPVEVLESGDNKEFYQDDLDRIDTEWSRFIRIKPLESAESFRIMEDFTQELIPEGKFRQQLISVLNGKKPFRNFKWLIEDSSYCEEWFSFKAGRLEEHVRGMFGANGLIEGDYQTS